MLKNLFEMCLNAKYIHGAEGGDYAIVSDGETIYLLFECSNGREDWKNNFDFPAKPYKRMTEKWYCHRGFLKVWKALRDEIEITVSLILKNHPEITGIVCVGYSHGAAISVLATEDMAYLYGKTHSVSGYGFGAPRVLWGTLPDTVKERLKCFTTVRNVPDIVTHVPPTLLGFRNAGTLKKIGRIGKYNFIDAHRPKSYLRELVM